MSKLNSKTKLNFRDLIHFMFHCALALDALRTNKVNSSPRRSLRVAELVVVVRILFEAQGCRKVLKTGGAR